MNDESPRVPQLPTRAPRRTLETAEFWDGCADRRFVLPRCDDCGDFVWYPRRFCPFCRSAAVTATEVSGHGSVYSFTVLRRGVGPFRDAAPYVLAVVELDEGPRLMTNIVGVDPTSVTIGQHVRVVYEPILVDGDTIADTIPRFTPI